MKITRTVLFCDLHDFSRLSLVIDGSLLKLLNRVYQTSGDCLVTRGGRIVKYLGDSILATFPAGTVDDAVEAAQCMRSAYAAIIEETATGYDSDMEVGISVGEVEEGEIGHPSFRSFDVFGSCINEAATIGHHRGIAITGAARSQLSDRFQVRQLSPVQAKWMDEPLAVWEVIEAQLPGAALRHPPD